ncbi:hypothetical protein B7463_g6499, partial [Scytalidium lignicola]
MMDPVAPPFEPNVGVSDTGLSVLHDGDNAIVDIILVHGLQGHPRRTWTCEKASNELQDSTESSVGHRKGLRKFLLSRHRPRQKDISNNFSKEVFWPLDLLPEDCPNSRILTWGYDSKVSNFFAGAANKSNVTAHARNLLQALKNRRRNCLGRSIIFIAHSLGGIIVKDVFRRAESDTDSALIDIYNSTVGIIFLGTPHRGSNKARYAEVLRKVVSAAGFDTATQNIKALHIDSTELEIIHELFMKLYMRPDRHFTIITFHEAKGIAGLGYLTMNERIVEPFSSTITNTEQIQTINADHMAMCRFASRLDEGYQQILGEIQTFISEIQKKQELSTPKNLKGRPSSFVTTSSLAYSLNETERKCVALLTQKTSNVTEYKAGLPGRVDGTCKWILSNTEYLNWKIQQTTCLLWISGYPGSGKTILSTFLTEYFSDGRFSPSLHMTLCYFFCDENIATQRDAMAILRSLIHQLIVRRRSLIKYVKASYDVYGPQFDQNLSELWRIFITIASDKRMKPLCVVIDALDECEESTRDRFLKCVLGLIHNTGVTNTPWIKFLITSRPNVGRRYITDLPQIDLSQNQIEDDLHLVIQSKVEAIVQRLHCKPQVRDYLEKALYSKADRTFLWVTLVLHLLENTYVASQKDLKLIIDRLPSTLSATYERFLSDISPNHQQLASRILHFIVGSYRSLTLEEMRILLAVQSHHRNLANTEEYAQPNIQETIEGILGPLVRIFDSRIHLVHLSLKEFLQDLSIRKEHPHSNIYGVDPQQASLLCLQACVTYLLFDDFNKDVFSIDTISSNKPSPTSTVEVFSEMESSELPEEFSIGLDELFQDPSVQEVQTCSNIAAKYSLFDYAATHWTKHCLSAGAFSLELQESVFNLSDTTNTQGLNWLRYYWASAETELSYPKNFVSVITASYFGYLTLLRDISHTLSISPYTGANAIYWASRSGYHGVVDFLLRQGLNPDLQINENKNPLVAAVEFNHPQVVKRLLVDDGFISEEYGYRVNTYSFGERTPLSIAAGNGFIEAVQLLLQHDKIKADIPSSNQWTPIFWAVNGGHLETFQVLLADSRISVNHLDIAGRNVLSWAASEGRIEIVKYLMTRTNIIADARDHNGRSALSWAAGKGYYDIAIYLRRSNKFDVSAKDKDGRNALSWACGAGHPKIVEYLLKYDPKGANDEDIDGWTPLSWALLNQSPRTVQVLVSSGIVDVNKKDTHGRSPLSFAVGYGYEDVVDILLHAEGIDVNSRNNNGRTPLSFAKEGSNIWNALKRAGAQASVIPQK